MTTHLERFDKAYDTLNARGAATQGLDVTAGLGFTAPNECVTVRTSPDGHPREDGYRAIGWLMTDTFRDRHVAGRATYMVNALCSPEGQVSSIYADGVDAVALGLGSGLNHGRPLTEQTPHDPTLAVESALVLIEQAVSSLDAAQ